MVRKKRTVPEGEIGARESSIAAGWTVEAEVGDAPEANASSIDEERPEPLPAEASLAEPESRPQLSSAMLVVLGVIGGVFLLYTWVWLSWAQASAESTKEVSAGSGSLGGFLQIFLIWIAAAAPAFWFISAFLLNRGRTARLVTWLAVGMIVLFPLPLLPLGGAAA